MSPPEKILSEDNEECKTKTINYNSFSVRRNRATHQAFCFYSVREEQIVEMTQLEDQRGPDAFSERWAN